jgi:hypothetical protein
MQENKNLRFQKKKIFTSKLVQNYIIGEHIPEVKKSKILGVYLKFSSKLVQTYIIR